MVIDIDIFGDRNLNVINILIVLEWFKEYIFELYGYQVLYCFFVKIMVDLVNLVFIKMVMQCGIQGFGIFLIVVKGFFDDDLCFCIN